MSPTDRKPSDSPHPLTNPVALFENHHYAKLGLDLSIPPYIKTFRLQELYLYPTIVKTTIKKLSPFVFKVQARRRRHF